MDVTAIRLIDLVSAKIAAGRHESGEVSFPSLEVLALELCEPVEGVMDHLDDLIAEGIIWVGMGKDGTLNVSFDVEHGAEKHD